MRPSDLSQESFDRLVDVLISFAEDEAKRKRRVPVAWRWYDWDNDKWNFCVRPQCKPKGAEPLYLEP